MSIWKQGAYISVYLFGLLHFNCIISCRFLSLSRFSISCVQIKVITNQFKLVGSSDKGGQFLPFHQIRTILFRKLNSGRSMKYCTLFLFPCICFWKICFCIIIFTSHSYIDIPGVFFYTLISFSCHFYTNQDIDMRFFVTCSGHRVMFL